MQIDGRFWLNKEGKNFLGGGRVELLEQIAKTGSIHAAAKAMKMSYKAAWERVNAMNNLADAPLIEKKTGGRGGGGTVLTMHAHDLIATFRRLAELHRQFIARFAEAGDDPERLARILSRTFLTTSARNQLPCSITAIDMAGVNARVGLRLRGGGMLLASITAASVRQMGLQKRCDAYAIIKSSDVTLCEAKSALPYVPNRLEGTILGIQTGANDSEVTIELPGGTKIVGIIDNTDGQGLAQAQSVCACIAPEHIILGI